MDWSFSQWSRAVVAKWLLNVRAGRLYRTVAIPLLLQIMHVTARPNQDERQVGQPSGLYAPGMSWQWCRCGCCHSSYWTDHLSEAKTKATRVLNLSDLCKGVANRLRHKLNCPCPSPSWNMSACMDSLQEGCPGWSGKGAKACHRMDMHEVGDESLHCTRSRIISFRILSLMILLIVLRMLPVSINWSPFCLIKARM